MPLIIIVQCSFIDARHLAVFLGLHALLPPTSVYFVDKKKKKITIKDSQKEFISIADTEIKVNEIIGCKKALKKNIQPFICVIGTEEEPLDFILYFDEILYKMTSITHAVDTCYKIFNVFNLKYPTECFNFWFFIQKYFFELKTTDDPIVPSVLQLVNQLNQ